MPSALEEKQVAAEAIRTLVNIKDFLPKFIFEPAGITKEIYKDVVSQRDSETGRKTSKRKMAFLILDVLNSSQVRKMVVASSRMLLCIACAVSV